MNKGKCRICAGDAVLPYEGRNSISFIKCHSCGYIAASPMPSADVLSELYDASHFRSSHHPELAENREFLEQRKLQYIQDRDLLLGFANKGRLLDFGCGNGQFLETFPDSFEKYGYEFNRTTTGYLKEHGGFRLIDTQKELGGIRNDFFDVIILRGVIEHLIDPSATLELLSNKLKPGGTLFICATPNADSPCALVYGTRWNQFTPPYHLHFFSPRTLSLLGARNSLAMIECHFPYLGTPYEDEQGDSERFVRDAENFLDGLPLDASPPFPGTMMSLVFRKVRV